MRVAAADHPALAPFRGDAAALLRSVRVLAVLPVRVPEGDPLVRTLLTLEDGTSLLVERKQAAGRIVYFATTADLDWTDLPARAAFLPLVQSLTLALAVGDPAPPEPPHVVGTPRRIPVESVPAGAVIRVTDPRGRTHVLTAPAAEFREVDLPGVYRVEMRGQTTVFVAAPSRAESDLARLDEEELTAKLPRGAVRIVAVRDAGQPAARGETGPIGGRQVDLSFYVLAGLLLVLAAESFVGARP